MKQASLLLALSLLTAFGCGDCSDSNGESNNDVDAGMNNAANNGGDAGVNNGSDADTNGGSNSANSSNNGSDANLLSVTLPSESGVLGPYTLAANTPVQLPLSFSLPADAGEVKRLLIDLEATAEAMGIVRTDGGTSADPTVNFRLGAVAGDDTDAACAAEPAVDLTITGNSDFSEKSATDDGSGVDGLLAADDGSNVFSVCFEVEASVDVELTPAAAIDLEIDAGCNEPAEDIAGEWSGTYTCSDTCNETADEQGTVDLTILQAGETAIYFDDGGAIYFGSVCGSDFRFVGGHPFYSEWGTFSRTGATTATKTSTWSSTMGDGCGGDCDDSLTLQ